MKIQINMQFKIFLTIVLFASSSMGQSTDVNGALSVLAELRQNISNSQVDLWSQLSVLRTGLSGQLSTFYTNASTLIDEKVKSISTSDAVIRLTLAEFSNQQLRCVIDATNFVDQTIQYSGYEVSNCVEKAQIAIDSESEDALSANGNFSAIEAKINILPRIIVDALIGRNIYTQFNEIETFASDNFASSVAEIEADLAEFEVSSELPTSWQTILSDLSSCFDMTRMAVNDGLSMIANRVIPSCQQFSKNPRARSSPPTYNFDPSEFYKH